ncbi:MAG: transglycosylase SLT domain-containing protein [Desulfobacterales bacterium]|nr:transglycosylase SLT domain-containing protein [Desulfobacterales bacterium]
MTIDDEWDEIIRQQQEAWLKFKEEVQRKWDAFVDSTKKSWVDYGKDLDARSEVNFEKGTIEIEAIVPAKSVRLKEEGTKKIVKQVRKIFSSDNPAKLEVLKDQVKNKKGEIVSSNNVEDYIKEEIVPQIEIEEEVYKAKDGVERIKIKARINLVPQHIRIRAEKYLKPVNEQSLRFQIEPQLILAIIHTESYFNPLAKSSCGALGLMQLIPRYGARDAYHFVYKKDKVLPPAYLYNPENNIQLGTAYVYLLRNKHFGHVNDASKNRYVTICAYNWGPTAVNRKILNRHNIDHMNSQQLYALLRQKTPQETRDYLKKVTERIKIYDNFY